MFPASCLLCGQSSGNAPICPDCHRDLPLTSPVACPCCGDSDGGNELCGHCLRQPPAFTRTFSVWRYAFPADSLIQALKYQHQLPLAPWFGTLLAQQVPAGSYDLVIPLPLHPSRLRERGFNQSALIAGALAKTAHAAIDYTSLQRIRATAAQAGLNLQARQSNVRHAFHCTREMHGKRILLVDDVMTTGATLREAARILDLHGAQQIQLGVIARAGRLREKGRQAPDSVV